MRSGRCAGWLTISSSARAAPAQWLGIFVTYLLLAGEDLGFWAQMGALLGIYVFINIVTAVIAVAAKWVILGRTKPGRYPLWGVYYFRWWLARRFQALVHIKWLQGSPAIRFYLRALGAKVGNDAIIADIDAGALDLVTIGKGTTIGTKVELMNAEIVGNELVIGRIHIGRDCYIGNSCAITYGAHIGDHAELEDLTAIPENTVVGEGEVWDGSPGRKVGMVGLAALPEDAQASQGRRNYFYALYAL